MNQKEDDKLSGFTIQAGEGVQKTLSGAANRSLVFTKEFHPSGMEFYRIRDYLEGWSTLGHVIDHTLTEESFCELVKNLLRLHEQHPL